MARYTSADVQILVDNASGVPVDLTQYIDQIGDIKISVGTVESHTFGDEWVEHLSTRIKQLEPIELRGFYDDTATVGPDAVLYGGGAALGSQRTLRVVYGGGHYTEVECLVRDYTRTLERGGLTRFACTLQPTGAVTEA